MTRVADTTGRLWPVTLIAVAFAAASAFASARLEGMTSDEPIHLEWSRRLLEARITERRSNEYFESKSPVSMMNVAARKFARHRLGETDPRTLLFWARLPTVGCFLLLLGAAHLVARAWFGKAAAHLATIACALDPSLIAHAALATVDVPFALFHLLALAAAYGFARQPGFSRALPLGIAVGLAFSAKFSAVLLIPAAALGFVARTDRPSFSVRAALGAAASVAVACGTAGLVVCASYLFTGVGAPLSTLSWSSRPMAWLAGNLPRLPLPLPGDFLSGLDLSLTRERDLKWRVVMFGRQYPRGVWFYFLVLWLMKTPLLVLAAQAVGYVRAAAVGLLCRDPGVRFLALNLLLLLAYFSLFFHAQIGYRFALMCLPLGYMIAAAGLATLADTKHLRRAAAVVFLTALGENSFYVGNHLAFTNLAVQPKKLVFRWITHSNVDWRQNEDKVDAYLASAGIGRERLDPPHLVPGLNLLRHYYAAGNLRFERYRWVREHLEPVAHFGHTFLLFDVSQTQFECFLDESRRVAPSALAQAGCPAGELLPPLAGQEPVALARGQDAIVCVSTSGGADLVLSCAKGSVLFGSADFAPGTRDRLQSGQETWYRLAPGRHALLATGVEPFTGALRVARGSLSLAFRPRGAD